MSVFRIKFLLFFLPLGFLLVVTSCVKDDQNDPRALDLGISNIPVVTTKTVTSITQVNAMCGGRIITDGGSPITSFGVCWSVLQNPTVSDDLTNDGSGIKNYSSTLSNLSVGTTYYARAFAKNKNGVGYGGEQVFTTISALAIGVPYQGGLVFYIDPSGIHGLVSSEVDLDSIAVWGCTNYLVPGADGAVLGSGVVNTVDIINNCHSLGIAAEICAGLNWNGYNDWFLPSKDELKLMYANLHVAHHGNFSNEAYWSSTEMTNVFAWQIGFNSGIVQGASKSTQSHVRAIRAF